MVYAEKMSEKYMAARHKVHITEALFTGMGPLQSRHSLWHLKKGIEYFVRFLGAAKNYFIDLEQ